MKHSPLAGSLSLCHGVKVRSHLRYSLLLGLRPRLHLDLPCHSMTGQRLVN